MDLQQYLSACPQTLLWAQRPEFSHSAGAHEPQIPSLQALLLQAVVYGFLVFVWFWELGVVGLAAINGVSTVAYLPLKIHVCGLD